MDAPTAAWDAVRAGARRALETPVCLAAVAVAAALQLAYEAKRPDAFPAAMDWVVTAAILAAFLAAVLRALAPSVSLPRAAAAFVLAQAASTAVLTAVFLAAKATFLSGAAPLVPVFFSALAAVAVLRGSAAARARWAEALSLGALYAVTALAFSLFMRLLPGGATALPATAFFAFMGLFAAAAPAALEDR
ncbi:MAG: hypothetical protein SF051_07190 [Elusimicrobiota bacterium]|nr:hypothetical protein [Elusimicrobiota bacterium]